MSDYDQQRVRIGIPQPTNIITLTQETYSVYDSSTGNPSFSNQSHQLKTIFTITLGNVELYFIPLSALLNF